MGPPAAGSGGQLALSPFPHPRALPQHRLSFRVRPKSWLQRQKSCPNKTGSGKPLASSHRVGPRPLGAPPSQGPLSWRSRFISDGGPQPRESSLSAKPKSTPAHTHAPTRGSLASAKPGKGPPTGGTSSTKDSFSLLPPPSSGSWVVRGDTMSCFTGFSKGF